LGPVKVVAGNTPCTIIIAKHEYESWFLGCIESLRGKRSINTDATFNEDPENISGAKGRLEEMMNRSYQETTDQAALTAQMNFENCYQNCRSFRKLAKDIFVIVRDLGYVYFTETNWGNLIANEIRNNV